MLPLIAHTLIPDYWKQGLDQVEDRDFKYTAMSLNDTYRMSFDHALEVIRQNRGSVTDREVRIAVQKPKPVKLEVEMAIGGKPVETEKFYTDWINRRETAFWRYQFDPGKHSVRFRILNPSDGALVNLQNVVVNSDQPARPRY